MFEHRGRRGAWQQPIDGDDWYTHVTAIGHVTRIYDDDGLTDIDLLGDPSRRQPIDQGCVNPGRQLMNRMHGGGGGAAGPGGLPEIMIGLFNGAFGSKWKVWQVVRSQPGTEFIPDAGHQI